MTPRQRNLLEAFRDAGDSGGSGEPSSAGPFAAPPSPPPSSGAESASPQGMLPSSADQGRVRRPLPGWIPLAFAAALIFVIGIVVGKNTGGAGNEVEAAGPDSEEVAEEHAREQGPGIVTPAEILSSSGGSPSTGGAPAHEARTGSGTSGDSGRGPAAGPRPADRIAALKDERNVYTVLVVTYGASQIDHARAPEDFLGDLGLPVFPPVTRGQYLEILVGAAPTTGELQAILNRVREATDWNGVRGAFKDAFVVKIDDRIQR